MKISRSFAFFVLVFLSACAGRAQQGSREVVSPANPDGIRVVRSSPEKSPIKTQIFTAEASDATDGLCKTTWSVSDLTPAEGNGIFITNDCGTDPSQRLGEMQRLWSAVLVDLLSVYAPATLHTAAGQFSDWSLWSQRVQAASEASPEWKKSERRAKYSGTSTPNAIVARLFQQADVARELREIFEKHGLRFTSYGMEKVFTDTVKGRRLATGAGVYHFYLK